MFFSSLNRPGLVALALVVALGACAPERDNGGDGGEGGVYGNTLAAAFFTEVDFGDWADYRQGVVAMVDDPSWTCADLSWDGQLRWWTVSDEVEWAEAFTVLGVDQNGWERDYASQYSWNEIGGGWSADSAFFWGQVGVGGENSVPVGREMTGSLGTQATQSEDQLTITGYSDDEVRGQITSLEGDYSFVATHCGIVYQEVDGDGDAPTEPTPG